MKLQIVAVVIVLAAIGAGAILYSIGVIGASATATTQYLTSPAADRRRHRGDRRDGHDRRRRRGPRRRSASSPGGRRRRATGPTPPATYPVNEVKVAVGDTVAEGDVLATADTTDLKRDLARAKNDLQSAQVSMRSANDPAGRRAHHRGRSARRR